MEEESAVEILKAWGNTMFGLCRLHKHFEITAQECVATEYKAPDFITYVAESNKGLQPWIWKYDQELNQWIECEYFVAPANFVQLDTDKVFEKA